MKRGKVSGGGRHSLRRSLRTMPPEKTDEERRQIIGRLEHQYSRFEAEKAKADAEAAALVDKLAATKDALGRAKLPFPPGNVCPECWVMHGEKRPLHAVPHPDPSRYDRWRCPSCEHVEDRRIGLR
jgi:hypothetical protein